VQQQDGQISHGIIPLDKGFVMRMIHIPEKFSMKKQTIAS